MIQALLRFAVFCCKRIHGLWMRVVSGLLRASAPLFLTEFQIPPGWDFPIDFKSKDWSGLLVCQIIDHEGSDARLLAWWDRPSAYSAYWASHFRQALALASPVFQGVMVQRKSNIDQWWKKGTVLYSIIISVVTVVTNWHSMRGVWDGMTMAPNATLSEPTDQVEMVAGDLQTLTITDTNHTSEDCTVKLDAPRILPVQGINIQEGALERKVPALGSQGLTYNLFGKTPGTYDLSFSGARRSGFFPGWRPTGELRCKVKVWPTLDETPVTEYLTTTKDEKGEEKGAVFTVTAQHGRAGGPKIEYRATIIGDDLQFDTVTGSGRAKPTHNSHSGGVAVLVWTADAKPVLDLQRFHVILHRSTVTDDSYWKDPDRKFTIQAYLFNEE